jgi:hypothetical protein
MLRLNSLKTLIFSNKISFAGAISGGLVLIILPNVKLMGVPINLGVSKLLLNLSAKQIIYGSDFVSRSICKSEFRLMGATLLRWQRSIAGKRVHSVSKPSGAQAL